MKMKMKMKEMEKEKMKKMKSLGGRKATIFKMAKQLSILCGVDAMLVYLPPQPHADADADADAHSQPQPETWSSKPEIESRYLTHKKQQLGKHIKKKHNSQLLNNSPNSNSNSSDDDDNDSNKGGFIEKMGIDDLNKAALSLSAKLEASYNRINSLKNQPSAPAPAPVYEYEYEFPDVIVPCNNMDWFNLGDLEPFEGLFNDYSHHSQQQQGLIGFQDPVVGYGPVIPDSEFGNGGGFNDYYSQQEQAAVVGYGYGYGYGYGAGIPDSEFEIGGGFNGYSQQEDAAVGVGHGCGLNSDGDDDDMSYLEEFLLSNCNGHMHRQQWCLLAPN